MGKTEIVILAQGKKQLRIGGKAEQLQELIDLRCKVPLTHVIPWDLFLEYKQDPERALNTLSAALAGILDLNKTYAVRSSANLEDGGASSFAGQFSSVLSVHGLDQLVAAVQTVWDSAYNQAVLAYIAAQGLRDDEIKMAVIVQEMVAPVVSGVAFSKNPLTGLDEIIVEAVRGSGEQLMQDGVTPDRWVYKWGAWIQQPPETAISEPIIADVVAGTQAIAGEAARPLDLEWVYSGSEIYWVQQREITTLQNINIYSNRISREVLPGMIKPLVWSINVPLVNRAWIDIFTELIGPNDIAPHELSKAFYYRAYFNLGVIGRVFTALGYPPETLEILMGLEGGDQGPKFRPTTGVIKHIPRMLRFLLHKLRFGREIDAFLPEMDRIYAQFAQKPVAKMALPELMETLEALIAFTTQSAYMNIVGPILMQIYNGLFKRNLTRRDIPYEQFDLVHDLPAIAQYDPNAHLAELHAQFTLLDAAGQALVREGSYAEFAAAEEAAAGFKTAVAQFITQFGHLSESGNDFSRVPWREDPDFVLRMIANWGTGAGEPAPHRDIMLHWDILPLPGFKKWRLRWLYGRARRYRFYREAISFKYTYGYGLIRNYILAIAGHFVESGLLAAPEDIFFLYLDELHALVHEEAALNVQELVVKRREQMESVKSVILPELIYGDQTPPPERIDADLEKLTGIPTSGGYFQGPICVINNLSEFDKMKPDAVLVIPYSDVSWTPLFARAGAVIAESGGMLSHSSIVAREQRVPAVVSVTGACEILQDGDLVSVDGYKGEIIIEHAADAAG